jgi:phage shock protein PspC (stress-responsive transcriptional regulator)
MIAGVASGIGRHLGVDVLLVRIAFVVLALAGGLGVPLYIACWLLIPEEGATQSIAGDFASDVQTWRN